MSNLNQRFVADRRQYGGMLMVTGFAAVLQPLASIVDSFNQDGSINTDPSEIPFWGTVGAFCLFLNGFSSVIAGFAACVADTSHILVTTYLIIINQLPWIAYITEIVTIGKMGTSDPSMQAMVPQGYEPTKTDVRFMSAMGVLTIFSYGFGYIGSLSFMAFGLHALNSGRYESHTAGYYSGRMVFYSVMLTIGGFAQLAVGAYCAAEFGMGSLDQGPVSTAFIVVHYPIVAVLVGTVQVMHGVWGIARGAFGTHSGPSDNIYQLSIAGQWIMVLALQDIMQVAYFDVGVMTPLAAGIAGISFGLNVMPAYLDFKMRAVPKEIPEGYYIEVPQKERTEVYLPEAAMDVSGRSRMVESVSNMNADVFT